MRDSRYFIGGLIGLLIFSAATFAQTEKTAAKGKVAVIDTDFLYDKDRGIKKYAEAVKSIYPEEKNVKLSFDTRRKEFDARRKELQKEIDLLIAQNKPVNEAYVKLKNLDVEYSQMVNRRNVEINAKYKNIAFPIYEEIKQKAKEFADLKGYSAILEKDVLMILAGGEIDDITLEFIKFCNESFEKEKSTSK